MSIVYIDIPDPFKDEILNFAKTEIYPKDIIEYELHPHITLMFGLATGDVKEVQDALGEFIPIRVMFGKTSMFMADNYRNSDVVKLDVFGMSMTRIRRILETLPNSSNYKVFTPHVTLAYVEPYTAIQYVGNNPVIGRKFVSDHVIFSNEQQTYKIYKDGNIEEVESKSNATNSNRYSKGVH